MPDVHATLSASSSSRWIHCPPSVKLTEGIPDRGSVYAAEGTEAHALCEYKLLSALGRQAEDPLHTPGGLQYYDRVMEDSSEGYAQYVMELVEQLRRARADPHVMVEQRLDFSRWVPGGFGTGDAVIIADGVLHVIDFKYGTGVPVSAEGNSQMRLYALGAIDMFGELYDVDRVVMTIYQPRLSSISTEELKCEELLNWAEEILRPAAELAHRGEGEQSAGAWCRFCKIRSTCRKRAEANLELAQNDFRLPPTLTDAEIAVILGRLDDLTSWAADIREYALSAAAAGAHFDGWKLVEGRANRRYINEDAVAEAVTAQGVDPYEHKLLGITAMEKLLGKKRFGELLGELVEKPRGKPVLVPESDKRPELENTGANDLFGEPITNLED